MLQKNKINILFLFKDGSSSDKLKQVVIPIQEAGYCDFEGFDSKKQICAGTKQTKKGTCYVKLK